MNVRFVLLYVIAELKGAAVLSSSSMSNDIL